MADNLPTSSADVTESGSLNLPEPSGRHRPIMGLLYFQLFARELVAFIVRKAIYRILSNNDSGTAKNVPLQK
jgi:hypothetical protein